MESTRLQKGTVIAGKYRIDSLLGEGGMGSVYRAQHLVLEAPVALKVIDRELTEGDVALARFIREARAAASLRSPHVVQVMDYGTEDERPYMVMELLEGESLAERLKRVGHLSPEETYQVLSHVARAVAKAHEAGIIHRDLKPDNVFLVHNGGDEIAKVLDFGVAKVETTQLESSGDTRTGSLLGTPYYMSPEQAQGNKEIDGRSDLWALGVIAYECLIGRRPFESDGLGDLVLQICIRQIPQPSQRGSVPLGFDDWFHRACRRELTDRFQSARELSEGLFDALGLREAAQGGVRESKWSSFSHLQGSLKSAESSPLQEAPLPPGVSLSSEKTVRPSELEHQSETTLKEFSEPSSSSPATDRLTRSSQWEVVPHGQAEEGIVQVRGLPERSVWGSSIYGILLLALIVGGGALYLAETKGYLEEILGLEQSSAVVPEAKVLDKIPDIPVEKLKEKSGLSKGKASKKSKARPLKASRKKVALAAKASKPPGEKPADSTAETQKALNEEVPVTDKSTPQADSVLSDSPQKAQDAQAPSESGKSVGSDAEELGAVEEPTVPSDPILSPADKKEAEPADKTEDTSTSDAEVTTKVSEELPDEGPSTKLPAGLLPSPRPPGNE